MHYVTRCKLHTRKERNNCFHCNTTPVVLQPLLSGTNFSAITTTTTTITATVLYHVPGLYGLATGDPRPLLVGLGLGISGVAIDLATLRSSLSMVVLLRKYLAILERLDGGVAVVLVSLLINDGLLLRFVDVYTSLMFYGREYFLIDCGVYLGGLVTGIGQLLRLGSKGLFL